jgi:hypothetical protein
MGSGAASRHRVEGTSHTVVSLTLVVSGRADRHGRKKEEALAWGKADTRC